MRLARMRNVDWCVALSATRRRHLSACALRSCAASSGAWLCPLLDGGTFAHAPGAHAQRRV
eukprot:1757878-Pleurochrysis_carterae.AAC.1